MTLSQLPQLHSSMTPPPAAANVVCSSPSLVGNTFIDRKPIYLPPMTPPAATTAMSTPPLHQQQHLSAAALSETAGGGGVGYYEHIKYSN